MKFLFCATPHLVWLRATGSRGAQGKWMRDLFTIPKPINPHKHKNNVLWLLLMMLTHTHPLRSTFLLQTGCYQASWWQMVMSGSPEKSLPSSETGEFKRSRMRLRLSSSLPQWLWHLTRATFHTEMSTTKPVSPGVIMFSKSTHARPCRLTLQKRCSAMAFAAGTQ